MPAAPLSDLRTSKTSILSVWFIENDRSNLERVVAAMAANLQHVDKFDCIIFPTNLLETVSIPIKTARGQTADNDANQRWHRNLVEITAKGLIDLAELIDKNGEMERFDDDDVESFIRDGITKGDIDKERINADLRNMLFGK